MLEKFTDVAIDNQIRHLREHESEEEIKKKILEQLNPNLVYNQLMENIDTSHTSNIVFDIIGLDDMKFFIKGSNLPGLTLNSVGGLDRRRDGRNDSYMFKLPGDEINLDAVSVTCFSDERMILYEKFLDLILRTSQRLMEYLLTGTIYFFDNVHHKCYFIYILKDMWINNVSGINWTHSSPAELDFTVSFTVNQPLWVRVPAGV
jgi:hypothetical protein